MHADLIERLEKATEPKRTLDRALSMVLVESGELDCHPPLAEVPHYTASIDAALTLTPKGANCQGFDTSPREVFAFVSCNNVADGHWHAEAFHKTSPAIALCIAALKARAAINPK